MNIQDIEAALTAANRTPSGRRSRAQVVLNDEHKQLCLSAASLYIDAAREDARIKWIKPNHIDFRASMDAHAAELTRLHDQLQSWRSRQDFMDLIFTTDGDVPGTPRRALVDYTDALHTAVSALMILEEAFNEAPPMPPAFVTTAIGEHEGKFCCNDQPTKAFRLWVEMTAGVWRLGGNTASAERRGGNNKDRSRNTPFVRFMEALQDLMPSDVRTTGSFGAHLDNVLRGKV